MFFSFYFSVSLTFWWKRITLSKIFKIHAFQGQHLNIRHQDICMQYVIWWSDRFYNLYQKPKKAPYKVRQGQSLEHCQEKKCSGSPVSLHILLWSKHDSAFAKSDRIYLKKLEVVRDGLFQQATL